MQVQEAYRTPNCQEQKGNTPRHIIIETLSTQNKERILKAAKEKDKSQIKQSHKITDFSNSNCRKVMERCNSVPEKQLST
jgi:hypothetical protein